MDTDFWELARRITAQKMIECLRNQREAVETWGVNIDCELARAIYGMGFDAGCQSTLSAIKPTDEQIQSLG